ncbi:glutathione S-transferase [Pseudoalteromonas sp. MMG010]|uniref:glutathione S-transferase family protein n=1 Tax=Pseudoalteromonas sp. MMG010 TaxID=2822685 RepID=UPI001B3A0A0C|nr:glutathione S-transferase [Pseudoalteromonas sp. MMG010]MBQ4833870.1 glutathione S-transferase [Pseudoalteromonas sp. MMG010]
MQLIGSTTSPYVRRIAMWAQVNNCDLTRVNLNIFGDDDRPTMIKNNPARKIPILIDDEFTITDSNNIIRYLLDKTQSTQLSWPQENLLTTINACNDSLVELFLCKRSGFDIQADKLFFNLQRERVEQTLNYLNDHLTNDEFKGCEYLNISLYCLLDWISFRELVDFSHLNELVALHNSYENHQAAISTDPRD